MNKYQRSMEDVSLSKEAKKRIADAVGEHFEEQSAKSTGNGFNLRSFTNRWGLVAAAAIVLLVVFAVPYGINHTKSLNQADAMIDNASPTGENRAGEPKGQTNPVSDGEKNPGSTGQTEFQGTDGLDTDKIAQEDGDPKSTDPSWILGYKDGKVSTTECTACRYALKGTTVEGIMSSILSGTEFAGTLNEESTDSASSDNDVKEIVIPEATEAGVRLFGKDGKVLYAVVPANEYAVVCSFLYPADPVSACKMAVELATFPFD